MSGIFLCPTLSFGSSFYLADCSMNFKDLAVPASPGLGLQVCTAMPGFLLQVPGNLNPALHACVMYTRLNELSPPIGII